MNKDNNRLKSHYKVGDRVSDKFHDIGVVIKVTSKIIDVKYQYCTTRYLDIVLPDFLNDLKHVD